ncbi:hypothetical protein COL13_13190 [Bacillus cereus]|nr:hypothetical protein COL13_13190 [Bacillus cereus]
MRKMDLFMKVLKEQQRFYQYSTDLGESTGLNLSEVFPDFNLLKIIELIVDFDLHGECYKELVNLFLTGEIQEEELEYKMLELDATLTEEICSEELFAIIKKLSELREDLQLRISELDDNGVYFRDLDVEQLLVDLLEKLRFFSNQKISSFTEPHRI